MLMKILITLRDIFDNIIKRHDKTEKNIEVVLKDPIKIGISPGHWGKSALDSGAVGVLGISEAILARDLSIFLYDLFKENKNFDTALYIEPYAQVSSWKYAKRVTASDTRQDKFYLALHFNSLPKGNESKNGFLIGFDPTEFNQNEAILKPLGSHILNNLNNYFDIGFADWDTLHDGMQAGFGKTVFELTKPKAFTIYFENGFLSNPDWEKTISNIAELKNMAKLIYDGFCLSQKEGIIK